MGKDVIIALDFPSADLACGFLDKFSSKKPYVKIGMELFYSSGPDIIEKIKNRGHKIFLDLKLHDIPNTVMRSMQVLAGLGVDMVNVHAAGTIEMMKAALSGLEKGTPSGAARPLLVAVTQLTSTSEAHMRDELLIEQPIDRVVAHYADCAKSAGLDGVVCSPLEVDIVKSKCGKQFFTITPGIRFEGGDVGDQVRIMTPRRAREIGSDYIVVGRPITAADDPVQAYLKCVNEFIS